MRGRKAPVPARGRRANERSKGSSRASPAFRDSRRSFSPLLALAAVALGAVAFSRSLHNPFVYDDHMTIGGNPSLVEPINVKAVLLHFPFRPLVNVSYAIDRSIWG